MSDSLRDKVAIVTGGSRGIGRAISLAMARHGAKVAINYRQNSAAAEECAAQLTAMGAEHITVQADVTITSEVERLVDTTISNFGTVSILVNNAGFNRDNLIVRMSDDDWDQVLNTNLKAAFLCIRAVLRPMMKQRWGRIINISSVAGVAGNAGQANYAAAKAGLTGLTRAIAREVGSRSITANVIAPGLVITELTEHVGEELIQATLNRAVLPRLGTPEDIAEAVAFLASEDAGYITGQVLMVDGGLGM
jgi:3-oxoacyl-[acyl-carrier protein] reductase